jgi:hypothetical protein
MAIPGSWSALSLTKTCYMIIKELRDNAGREVNVLTELAPGKYRHYKGNDYEVIGCAKHSETLEEYVVYRALYGEGGLWIRPKAMFMENVTVNGVPVPRFAPQQAE